MTPAVRAALAAAPCVLVLAGLAAERPEGALVWSLCAALLGAALHTFGASTEPAPRERLFLALGLVAFAAATAGVAVATGAPRPLAAAGPAVCLFGLGVVAASRWRSTVRAALPLVAALLLFLGGLPDLFGSGSAAWARTDPAVGAFVLDLSPATWVCETAGLDWMRHPSVYAPAGTDWFSDVRRPFGPTLGLAALATGLLAVFAARRRTTTRNAR
ncbi:hypothetical protein Pla163_22920 [Planctomycetes bacterium Pla163]|uniref:Uncharacterized protein n=1 Tax=Rohdeia mirabilis TaxID=2528008 RepID=A0A518D101_9BACT|nr:hypothetical protein Pla163_22920 [Planctomycetes bacterium Pla163]